MAKVSQSQISGSSVDRLASIPLFKDVNRTLLADFAQASRTKTFTKNTMLFLQDEAADHFYIVLSGWVKLSTHTIDGDEAVIDMLNAGSVFGETALLDDDVHSFSATVVEDAALIILPNLLLKRSIEEDNKLALGLLSSLQTYRKRKFREFEGMQLQNTSQRVGCFLLRLSKGVTGEHVQLRLPYDKGLIASRLNMKPETFSRSVGILKKEIGLSTKGSLVTIPDIDRLARYTCSACSDEYPCSGA
jgi:CRP-like cAMP-binding protein